MEKSNDMKVVNYRINARMRDKKEYYIHTQLAYEVDEQVRAFIRGRLSEKGMSVFPIDSQVNHELFYYDGSQDR